MSKILIVESTGFLCRLLAKSITENGYAAMVAKSAKEAIERVGKSAPAMVLLDLELRAKSSPELICKRLRAAGGSDLPIYLVTSKTDNMDKRVKKYGACGYFRKPLSPKDFSQFLAGLTPEEKTPSKEPTKASEAPEVPEIEEPKEVPTVLVAPLADEHLCRVLVVQDEGDLCAELKACGDVMEFCCAQTMEAAIEIIQDKRPCLLIFDMDWKSSSAEEACLMLSQWDMKHIPTVLILSSLEDAEEISSRMGAEAYHLKPISGLFVYSWLEQKPRFLINYHKK